MAYHRMTASTWQEGCKSTASDLKQHCARPSRRELIRHCDRETVGSGIRREALLQLRLTFDGIETRRIALRGHLVDVRSVRITTNSTTSGDEQLRTDAADALAVPFAHLGWQLLTSLTVLLAAISFTWATLAWGYPRWLALASSLIVALYAVYSSLLTTVLLRYHRKQRMSANERASEPESTPPAV